MLWTSIATRKTSGQTRHPWLHQNPLRMAFFDSPHQQSRPSDQGFFWNILNQHGKRSVVVGLVAIASGRTDRRGNGFQPFRVPHHAAPRHAHAARGGVATGGGAGACQNCACIPTEISQRYSAALRARMGRARESEGRFERARSLAGLIAETMSIHAAATDLMARIEWDLAAVYYVGIDHFSHRFMRFHAGKARAEKPGDPEWFRGIVANAYRYHDVMLGRLLALAGEDCGVMVISDHGFHSDALLPDYIPAEAAGPAVEHRHFGIYCLRAPGVKRGERVYGASVLDVAPTILHLFGIPAGIDMDGKVLINAFEDQRLPEPVPSWDEIPGHDGRHPPSRYYDSAFRARRSHEAAGRARLHRAARRRRPAYGGRDHP